MAIPFRESISLLIAAQAGPISSTASMAAKTINASQDSPAHPTIIRNATMMMSGGMIPVTGVKGFMITVNPDAQTANVSRTIVIQDGHAQTATTKHTGILTVP